MLPGTEADFRVKRCIKQIYEFDTTIHSRSMISSLEFGASVLSACILPKRDSYDIHCFQTRKRKISWQVMKSRLDTISEEIYNGFDFQHGNLA